MIAHLDRTNLGLQTGPILARRGRARKQVMKVVSKKGALIEVRPMASLTDAEMEGSAARGMARPTTRNPSQVIPPAQENQKAKDAADVAPPRWV